jgi:hypothetical protein
MSFLINSFAPAQLGVPAFNTLTPVFCCGFECGQLASGGTFPHFTINGGTPTISTSTIRSAARSLRCNPNGITAQSVKCNVTPATIQVYRFYVRFTTLPTQSTYITFVTEGGATDIFGVAFKTSDSKLYCATGSSPTFTATGVAVTTGTWYRIDVKIDSTFGAKKIDAQVDGAALSQGSTAGTGAASHIYLGTGQTAGVATADIFYDDFLMSNTAANYPLGAGHVDHFVPTADGTHSTGTAGSFIKGAAGVNITGSTTDSYLLVDDVPVDDITPDTNDYITQTNDTGGGALYVEHIFGPASGISTPTTPPRAVEVLVGYHTASAGTSNKVAKLNDQGTEDTILNSNTSNTQVNYERKHYANPPTGLGGWSLSGPGNFNDLRHRWGYSTDGNPDVAMDCVMVEAEFSPDKNE